MGHMAAAAKSALRDLSEAHCELGRLYTEVQWLQGKEMWFAKSDGESRYSVGDCSEMGLSAGVIRMLKVEGRR